MVTSYLRELLRTNPEKARDIATALTDGYIRAALSRTYTNEDKREVNWERVRFFDGIRREAEQAVMRVH